MERNARFLVPTVGWDTWTKITLRPGESLSHGWSARHEEGWSSGGTTWEHLGDAVRVTRWDRGTDCDGLSGNECTSECPLDRLATVPVYPPAPGQFRPDWQPVRASQFDAAAEAAGY